MEDLDDFLNFGFDWNSGLATKDEKFEEEFEELYKELEEAGTLAAKTGTFSRPEDIENGSKASSTLCQLDEHTTPIHRFNANYNTNLDKVKDLGSVVEELSEELSILLFFQTKCLMKNKKYSDYLRLNETPSYSQVQADLKRKFNAPYISLSTESGFLAAPSANKKILPFNYEELHEWGSSELHKLELCVHRSYYFRIRFFIESRFQQMYCDMGFTLQDLNRLDCIQKAMEHDVWNVIKQEKISDLDRKTKYYITISKFMLAEQKLMEELEANHTRDRIPISAYRLRLKTNHYGVESVINLSDMIVWKQREIRHTYIHQLNRKEKIEIDQVDWQMVERDMDEITNRKENAESLKYFYKITKSGDFNHQPFSARELAELKRITKASKNQAGGINWADAAKELGTNRSPIRLFQSYKNFICTQNRLPCFKTHNDRLKTFHHVKKYLGHYPRVVDRLSKNYDQISYSKFPTRWVDINPRFALGDFKPIEDVALMVAIELHSEELIAGQKFSLIQHHLPWRYCNVWRKRASLLFRNYDNWTFDEDKLLLFVTEKYGLDWPGLEKVFNNRTKYSCMHRLQVLQERLQKVNLKQYHATYSRRHKKTLLVLFEKMYNILDNILREMSGGSKTKDKKSFANAPDISGFISDSDECDGDDCRTQQNMTLVTAQAPLGNSPLESKLKFVDLCPATNDSKQSFTSWIASFNIAPNSSQSEDLIERVISTTGEISMLEMSHSTMPCIWNTPRQEEIWEHLKTFDRSVLQRTLDRLGSVMKAELDYDKSTSSSLRCNRRKFDVNDPVSVASALHLQQVPLRKITREAWGKLTEFEKSVCRAYQAFHGGWKTKKFAQRHCIPSSLELAFLPIIRNIIESPKELAKEPEPYVVRMAPLPPQILTLKQGHSQTQTSLLSEQNVSSVNEDTVIDLVQPTPKMVNAKNRLLRRVWNSSNTVKIKSVQRHSIRKALNLAAAKIRWDKEKERKASLGITLSELKKEKQIKREPWHEILLRNYGKSYQRGVSKLELDEISYKSKDWPTGGPDLLNMLHDHSYCSGYASWVQKVVTDIRTTLSDLEVSDSAKENDENGN